MDNQKSKSTFSATLLSLTLMVAAFWVSSAVAVEKKMDQRSIHWKDGKRVSVWRDIDPRQGDRASAS